MRWSPATLDTLRADARATMDDREWTPGRCETCGRYGSRYDSESGAAECSRCLMSGLEEWETREGFTGEHAARVLDCLDAGPRTRRALGALFLAMERADLERREDGPGLTLNIPERETYMGPKRILTVEMLREALQGLPGDYHVTLGPATGTEWENVRAVIVPAQDGRDPADDSPSVILMGDDTFDPRQF